METRYSYCRNCAAVCGAVFEVDGNEIVSHRPDRDNHLSEGFFCIKGDMAVELTTGREARLTHCLVRDGGGDMRAVGGAEAVATVAHRLRAIIAEHGVGAVGIYYGTATYGRALSMPVARAFMAAIGSPKIFSTMTIDQSARWVAFRRMGMFATGKPNIADTDLLLMCGTNPLVSHIPNYGALPGSNQHKHIRAMRARGGKLVIIDPRLSETARLADLHIQCRPGFDADIFAGLIRLLLERDGWRKDFCDRYVVGIDALRAAVAPFTPEKVAARAGIPAAQLEQAVDMLMAAGHPVVEYGTGMTMSPHGDTAAHLAEALNALCAGYVRAGQVLRSPGAFMPRPTVEMVVPPDREWEKGPRLHSGHGHIFGEFPTSRLPDEILQDGPDKLRALFVLGANPLATWGEPDRAAEALRDLDLLVVLDPRLTETAELADVVVAPPVQYEVDDISLLMDFLMHKPVIQFTRPVVQPPADVLEEWRFFHEVAKALGHRLRISPLAGGEGGLDLDPDVAWDAPMILRWFVEQAGLSWGRLSQSDHGYPLALDPPVVTAPVEDDGARLDLCPPDVAMEIAAVAADDRAHAAPYRLTCRRIVETMNTAFRDSSAALRRFPDNPLHMNPQDMLRDGLADGDRVRVKGRHGELTAVVKPDGTMRPGVLSYNHGWGAQATGGGVSNLRERHVGRLVSFGLEHVQSIDAMPFQSSIPVAVERLAAGL